jgi:hypothetical protein
VSFLQFVNERDWVGSCRAMVGLSFAFIKSEGNA